MHPADLSLGIQDLHLQRGTGEGGREGGREVEGRLGGDKHDTAPIMQSRREGGKKGS